MARVDRTTLLRPAPHLELALHQPERGYRFNADSIHLVHFAATGRAVDALCDLGAGCGVIGLSLLALGAAKRGTFVELDAEQAARCERNLRENGLAGDVVHADVEGLDATAPCGLVVCNPPYFAPDEGRPSPDPDRTRARFGGIERFTSAAARACGPRGRACFVYPAGTSMRLLAALRGSGLEPKRMRWIHPRAEAPARLLLVEARAGRPGGLVVESPRIEEL